MSDNQIMKKNKIAKTIKEERKKHQLTQVELSNLSGVSIATIRAIEQGSASPNVDTLNRILRLFNLEIDVKRIEK